MGVIARSRSRLNLKISFLTAFLLRIIIAPWGRHSDCDNTFHWAKYLWDKRDFFGFLGKAIPNAMPAMYPPIFYYLIFLWRGFYELIGKILWKMNVTFPIFPSNLIFWYQSYQGGVAFNKVPAILADLGCAFLIYKISLLLGGYKKIALLTTVSFLFLPPYWYNSAHWGQDESIYSLFLLLCLYSLIKSRIIFALLFLFASVLIKQSAIIFIPIFFVFCAIRRKISDLIIGSFLSMILIFLLYFPFQPILTIPWAVNFYTKSLRGELPYLVCNAFNFWTLLFGFEPRSTEETFFGVSLGAFGIMLFLTFFVLIIFRLSKSSDFRSIVICSFLSFFAAFLFLPKMHERYLYTALIFLAIMGGLKKRFLHLFFLLSILHFINLYHLWWSPRVNFLVSLFSNLYIIKFIIIFNILVFATVLKKYLRGALF